MEVGIVLIIALVVFGPKRLPDLGHSLGKGIREFKGSINGEEPDEPAEPKPVEASAAAAPVVEPKTTTTSV
jgi:sec-independent protein translocase protein TatA